VTDSPVALLRSDDVLPLAARILELERAMLLPALPGAELLLTGSSSIPGLLTRGDVDLHLRVPAALYDAALDLLRDTCVPVNGQIWTDGFATFETHEHEVPTGIAVTAIGDEHDELFRRTWDRLRADPDLADAFNAVKQASQGDVTQYLAAKRRFLDNL
jgi:GrpB-like predicted nucleotidyltransferase (UPF0157 family)